MARGPRDELYARLPALAGGPQLSDLAVVLSPTGLFLTVSQAWHAAEGVVARCLPGALELSRLGAGYGTGLPEFEIGAGDPPHLLLGRLGDGHTLRLRHDDASAGRQLRAYWAGYGRYRTVDTPAPAAVRAGDVLVLQDGHAHEVLADGGLRRVGPDWSPRPAADERGLDAYLASCDLPELPLVRLR